jgi:hypothetical protein
MRDVCRVVAPPWPHREWCRPVQGQRRDADKTTCAATHHPANGRGRSGREQPTRQARRGRAPR